MTALLLTGKPRSGKTTLIRSLVERLARPAGGFYTVELSENGERTGFEIVTLDGQRGLLARLKLPGAAACVGRFGITLEALEDIGVRSIRAGIARGLVIIDEIGPMENRSPVFRAAVLEALDSSVLIIGSIVKRHEPFADMIKARPDVRLVEVTPERRDALLPELVDWLERSGEQT